MSNLSKATQDTIDLVKGSLNKAWVQSGSAVSGMTNYDLEAGAKLLFPVLTPLLKKIPRTSGKGGIRADWRGVTAINSGGISPGVGQGNRGGIISTTTKDYNAVYKTLGFDDNVTIEAELAAEGFDDLRSMAIANLLKAVMLGEERTILGGNGGASGLSLGTTPTPTVVGSATGGALNGTISVVCVALGFDGLRSSGGVGSVTGIPALVTRTNADGSVESYGGGSGQKSAAATGNCGGASVGSFTATVAAVRGALGYAWFWGVGGSEVLGAVTTINSIAVTTAALGTQTAASLPSTDNSVCSLVYDGLLTLATATGSGGYYRTLATGTAGAGTPLTADGTGGVVEINDALKYFWQTLKLSPTSIIVGTQEQQNVSNKVLAGQANAAQRFIFNTEQGSVAGGNMVTSYLNKFSMSGAKEIPIELHPDMPDGTILFLCDNLPYPLSNVSNVMQIRCRRDYYATEYPRVSRKYEYGVNVDSVLQHYFPPSLGVITNIANG